MRVEVRHVMNDLVVSRLGGLVAQLPNIVAVSLGLAASEIEVKLQPVRELPDYLSAELVFHDEDLGRNPVVYRGIAFRAACALGEAFKVRAGNGDGTIAETAVSCDPESEGLAAVHGTAEVGSGS